MFDGLKEWIKKRRDKKVNGCGPWFIPNFLRSRFFSKQCNIHDLDYEIVTNTEDKDEKEAKRDKADIEFKENMLKELDRRTSKGDMSLICIGYRSFQVYFFYYSVKLTGSIYLKFLRFSKK